MLEINFFNGCPPKRKKQQGFPCRLYPYICCLRRLAKLRLDLGAVLEYKDDFVVAENPYCLDELCKNVPVKSSLGLLGR